MLVLRPGVRTSFRAIARELAVSEGTVRNRIEKMRASGFLRGSTVIPNPGLLGISHGAYTLEASSSLPKQGVIERLRLIDGVWIIQDYHSGLVGIAFAFESEQSLQRKLELFKLIAGSKDGFFSRIPLPPCTTELTGRDWELIQILAREGAKTFRELANGLRVSTRTLKRKMSNLMSAGAMFSFLNFDYGAIEAGVPADLAVICTTPQARAEAEDMVLQIVDDFWFYAGRWERFGLYNLIIPNALTATRIAKKVGLIDGVELARVDLVDEHIDRSEILSDYITRNLSLNKVLGHHVVQRRHASTVS